MAGCCPITCCRVGFFALDLRENLYYNSHVDRVAVAEVLRVIERTVAALLAVKGWRGTIRFCVHIDADTKSVKVVPEIMLVV